jgi:excisionase family DNA binding protein
MTAHPVHTGDVDVDRLIPHARAEFLNKYLAAPDGPLIVDRVAEIMAAYTVDLLRQQRKAILATLTPRALKELINDAPAEQLISARAVARLFGANIRSVWNWAQAGQLPSHRTPGGQYRFRVADVDAFIRQRGEQR